MCVCGSATRKIYAPSSHPLPTVHHTQAMDTSGVTEQCTVRISLSLSLVRSTLWAATSGAFISIRKWKSFAIVAGVGAGSGNGCHRAVEITLTRQLRLGICAGYHGGCSSAGTGAQGLYLLNEWVNVELSTGVQVITYTQHTHTGAPTTWVTFA